MMLMKTLLSILLLLPLGLAAHAESTTIEGQVIKVIDGNTLEIKTSDNDVVSVILYGVDCPEMGQPFYDEATQCIERLLLKKDVIVQLMGKDRKGNPIGIVTTEKGNDPRIKLLTQGLAWTLETSPLPELETHRLNAQEKGVGIWGQKEPKAPWLYRREQTMIQPKSS